MKKVEGTECGYILSDEEQKLLKEISCKNNYFITDDTRINKSNLKKGVKYLIRKKDNNMNTQIDEVKFVKYSENKKAVLMEVGYKGLLSDNNEWFDLERLDIIDVVNEVKND